MFSFIGKTGYSESVRRGGRCPDLYVVRIALRLVDDNLSDLDASYKTTEPLAIRY
ncbi:hypothetical protein [Stieleria marina]|uniref:hypothetical protein n=1 Tax=Stieleria marina TaxID=1930275 RepID=UPI003AF3DDBF